MKKCLVVVLCCILLCGCTKIHAKDAVISYLEKYRNFTTEIEQSLIDTLDEEKFTKEQREQYILLMKKQFVNLTYKIKEEIYNGDKATIVVNITVYDYHHSIREALKENSAEENYINLQLEKMSKEKKKTTYTIAIKTRYEENTWIVEQPDEDTIKKIQGTYYFSDEILD